ncbi:hypothetical protein ACEQ6C_38050, partial [Rhizobium ruizarguesonis]
ALFLFQTSCSGINKNFFIFDRLFFLGTSCLKKKKSLGCENPGSLLYEIGCGVSGAGGANILAY